LFNGYDTSGYILYDYKTRSVSIPCFQVTTIAKFGDGIEGETIYYNDVSMRQQNVADPIFHVEDMTKTNSCESSVIPEPQKPPQKLTLTTTPTTTKKDSVEVEINGKVGTSVFVNGVDSGKTIGSTGKVKVTLDTSGDDGDKSFSVTLKDSVGNESEALTFIITKENTLTEGLVAHYEFEGNAKDSSGNDNNGTEHGGVSYVDGVIGKAGSFDGVDDRIKINNDVLDGLNLFTINMVLKLNDNGSVKHFISGANSNEDNEFIIRHDNGSILIYYKGRSHKMSSTIINDNSWHSLTLVKFSTNFKLYIDGNFDSDWKIDSANNLEINNNGLWIGTDQDCVGGCFQKEQHLLGLIDDLRIYNRALNEAEIQELYKMNRN